jgi:3' exoribonuclease, RNase T-like
MAKHLMVDLETLATTPDASVLTIGAVKFNPDHSFIDRSKSNIFYRRISLESCSELGLVEDPGTLDWWAKQAPEIIEEAFHPENRHPIQQVMEEFTKFCWGCDRYWSHGSIFDIIILEHIYRKLGKGAPWNFWDVRDTRTLFDLGYDPEMPKDAKHNALEDAYRQARGVQNMMAKIKRR